MEALSNSFLLVLASEMGDKTQLLALLLAARFKRPWAVMAGVVFGSFLSHTLASWTGVWISTYINPDSLKWILAATFFTFAAWMLLPEKSEDIEDQSRFGPFLATAVAFFFGEMGDKTQLASVALGARYSDAWMVTAGATLAMAASNAIPVFLGGKILEKISIKWIRLLAAAIFAAFGVFIILN